MITIVISLYSYDILKFLESVLFTLMTGIFGHADDSIVVESYVLDAGANSKEIWRKGEAMITRLNLRLKAACCCGDWGDANGVWLSRQHFIKPQTTQYTCIL